MGWIEVHCHGLDSCQRSFKVDEDLDEKRCPGCGETHTAPWGEYDRRPAPAPESDPEEDHSGASDDVALQAGGGVTIRITIEVLPGE